MTQQERIQNLAHEQIVCIAQGGTRQWGKSFKAGFKMAVKFTLENLWISVDEALPPKRKTTNGEELEESIPVFVRDNEGNYTSAWYSFYGKYWYMAFGEAFLKQSIYSKITHWMLIPELKEGGEKCSRS